MKCIECNEEKIYFYIHDDKHYCDECYGKHTPEVDIVPIEFILICPFCDKSMRFKTLPDRCRCGAKITYFGTPKGKARFIKWN